MLALSPPRQHYYSIDDAIIKDVEDDKPQGGGGIELFDEFGDFSDSDLLIDFDDLFVGINDGDVLPDLEIMDPQLLADLSNSATDDSNEKAEVNQRSSASTDEEEEEVEDRIWGSEITSKKGNKDKQRKSSSSTITTTTTQSKNHQGKRKVKVDWTPELHKRFVQAVDQLSVDKAVPSRILELMGIDCLTRHNIASHLQKYRSHRKHLLVREAEAATWTQKRSFYNATANGGLTWAPPAMGFPPMPLPHTHFSPLHVWGHPRIDQSMWPKHLSHPSPPPLPHPSWPPGAPLHDPSYWHHLPRRFITPPVPGFPPSHGVYKAEHRGIGQSLPHPLLDFHPSKESIDAAIGDVMSKPWLPLPLGLKPPSIDGVLVELQRQGVPKMPSSCTV